MKKAILLALVVVMAAGCSAPRRVYELFIDFTPYTSAGFYVTPDQCPSDYEPTGQLYLTVYPAIVRQQAPKVQTSETFQDGLYSIPASQLTLEQISSAALLELVVKAAVNKEAEGLSSLEIVRVGTGAAVDHFEISATTIRKKQ